MLSARLLRILRIYWRLAKPEDWLFSGRVADRPIDVQVLYSACHRSGRIEYNACKSIERSSFSGWMAVSSADSASSTRIRIAPSG